MSIQATSSSRSSSPDSSDGACFTSSSECSRSAERDRCNEAKASFVAATKGKSKLGGSTARVPPPRVARSVKDGAREGSVPATSGLFDYVQWLFNYKIDANALKSMSRVEFRVADLSAGMGPSLFASQAIRYASRLCGQGLSINVVLVSEVHTPTRALYRGIVEKSGTLMPIVLSDDASLGGAEILDEKGDVVNLLGLHILSQGIVCKDISAQTSTPRSLMDKKGKSVISVMNLLSALRRMKFEDRPIVLILECTSRLDSFRKVDNYMEKGTKQLTALLEEEGYEGQFHTSNALHYYLPQDRLRVYGLFFRRTKFGDAGRAHAKALQIRAMAMAKKFQVEAGHEPLESLVSRITSWEEVQKRKAKVSRISEQRHDAYIAEHRLEDFYKSGVGKDDFVAKTNGLLHAREQDALWVVICKQCMGQSIDWRKEFYLASAHNSVSWMTIGSYYAPTVTTKSKFAVLRYGEVLVGDGALALSLQGYQSKELKLASTDLTRQPISRVLAGNAFAANVYVAHFIAALLVLAEELRPEPAA